MYNSTMLDNIKYIASLSSCKNPSSKTLEVREKRIRYVETALARLEIFGNKKMTGKVHDTITLTVEKYRALLEEAKRGIFNP